MGTFDFADHYDTSYWDAYEETEISVPAFYTYERSTTTPLNHSFKTDKYSVGLMYPSDYGYTFANGVNNSCYESIYGQNCSVANYQYSWLTAIDPNDYDPEYVYLPQEWFITPFIDTKFAEDDYMGDYAITAGVWITNNNGGVEPGVYTGGFEYVNGYAHNVRPVVYLNADVEINTSVADQDGSASHPYFLRAGSSVSTPDTSEIDDSGITTPNAPNLDTNMLPVVYNENTNKWVMSVTTAGTWYDYTNQKWANAVTVKENKRGTYSVGDTIEMDDILGMWVWIPRFEYKYTNLNSYYVWGTKQEPGSISIKFISGTSTTETTNYIIHPAFRNGSVNYTNNAYTTTSAYQMGGWNQEITGFWMGKFETSSITNAESTTSSIDSDPIVKPNVAARRYQTVSDQFNTLLGLKNSHGISTLDSHMSKNSEWGAVLYLAQSKYGKYGNSNYVGWHDTQYNVYYGSGKIPENNKEIFLNDSAGYFTGRSSGFTNHATYEIDYSVNSGSNYSNTNTQGTYEYNVSSSGTGASTTGNIYGIYDMVGGSADRQAGWTNTGSSEWGGCIDEDDNDYNDSGFEEAPSNHKYYEEYTSINPVTACGGNACYGHALSETLYWYTSGYEYNYRIFWYIRGGTHNYFDHTGYGMFGFYGDDGANNSTTSMRAVLT